MTGLLASFGRDRPGETDLDKGGGGAGFFAFILSSMTPGDLERGI